VLLSWIKKLRRGDDRLLPNIGQEDELTGLAAKAKKTGASKIYIDDLQEEFRRDFIYPIIQAGAIYEGQYFLGTSIARAAHRQAHGGNRQKGKGRRIAHGPP